MVNENGVNLLSDLSMFQLCFHARTHRKVMDPRADCPRHIKASRTVHGQDLSGTLLCHTKFKEAIVRSIAGHKGLTD